METKHECKCCGKEFEPTCHKIRQIYCSEACRIKYNNAKRYAPPENACLECGATLTQSGQCGKNRKFCTDACRRAYHAKKAAEKKRIERQTPRICPNCGGEFVPMWEKGGLPRYCSDDCRIEWWKEYHRVTPDEREPNSVCAYCGKALEKGNKQYCSRACYRLGTAKVRGRRRCEWCGELLPKKAQAGQKYCCQSCAASAWKLRNPTGVKHRCITTRNSGAWRKQLAELAKGVGVEAPKNQRIYLICGLKLVASTERLIEHLRYELKCDPYDGSIYVFCGNERTLLKWLEWDGSGFCVGFRHAEWGTYPWPAKKAEAVMEITRQEYDFLRVKSTHVGTKMP